MTCGCCLCGAVSFRLSGKMRGVIACHCRQCRKQSGHLWSTAYAPQDATRLEEPLRWYEASQSARHGFRARCGSFLFWKAHDEDTMSFAREAIDGETGLALEKHIFGAGKGDYYEIGDNVPQTP